MDHEYLIAYGALGDFGRFRPARLLKCRRGDRVVIRTHRGVELGEVLRDATPGHAQYLPNTTVGTLLRLTTGEDDLVAATMRERAAQLCDEARKQTESLGLPLVVLDAEMLLDGEHAALHFVRSTECDVRPLVSGLSTRFAVHLLVEDLTSERKSEHSCGSCGSGGGCGDCGSGGCGSCGSAKPEEAQAHFAGLREEMMAQSRVPLL